MFIGGNYSCIYNYKDLLYAINHTKKISGNNLQIFVGKNTSTTTSSKQKGEFTDKELNNIKILLKKLNIKIFIHGSLSLNLCNPLIPKYNWSLENLLYDLNFGYKIGAVGVVIHLGTIMKERYTVKNNSNKNIEKEAYKNMVKTLEKIIIKMPPRIKILIETSAGQKGKIATSVEDLGKLYNMIKLKYRKRVGICIDTCHIFSSGYSINIENGFMEYIKKFNKHIGINHIKLIHLNDSKTKLGERKDLHENLMKGYIFNKKNILREIILWIEKYNIPIILETRNVSLYYDEIKLIKNI